MLAVPAAVVFRKGEPTSACRCALVIGLVTGLLMIFTTFAYGEWKPPAKPSPYQILNEARDDAAAGRYADALAKHVWFHENALRYAPGMYGVRLSFALSDWANLAACHPPALTKLKAIRDEAGMAVREGRDPRNAFHDLASINRELKEQEQTKELFLWLDVNKPDLARQNFDIAQPALVEAKEYRLSGKYLNPDRSLKGIVSLFRESTKVVSEYKGIDHEDAIELQEQNSLLFSDSVATLVALLALNDRTTDADRIAAEALKEWSDQGFKESLVKARKGELPPPRP